MTRLLRTGGTCALAALTGLTGLALTAPLALAAPLPTGATSVASTTSTTAEAPALLSATFDTGLQGWGPRGAGVSVQQVAGAGREGSGALSVTGRTQNWHGPSLDVTGALTVGDTVQVSAWARLAPGQQPTGLTVTLQSDRNGSSSYANIATGQVTADGWTQLRGSYTLATRLDRAELYVEGPVGVSFLLDDFALTGAVQTPLQDVPALKDVLGSAGFEHVGVAVDQRETVGRASQMVQKHFNAITPENDGKPEVVQPREGTFDFSRLDTLLDFADRTGTKVYGHVFVWHSQTPAWVFQRPDGTPLTNSPADQAILKARMEAHIKGIADHMEKRYPDGNYPIWAWDVVNEVVNDGDNANPHDMRDSRWFQVLGEEFVDQAFRLADQYFPDAKLFINDYNSEMPEKRADYVELVGALLDRGVPIDGVGHQVHVDFARPVQWLDDSLTAFERLSRDKGKPLLQVITELDVSTSTEMLSADVGSTGAPRRATDDDVAAGVENGYYYRDLFAVLRKHSGSIESVTFWGISNARTWLRTWPLPRPWEQPLPFDDDLNATPAYWGIVDPSKLPARPADFLGPRIAQRSTVSATATSPAGARVDYALPVAGDTREGALRPTCSPAPADLFPVGTTTVTCTLKDSAGNSATPTTFDVVVAPGTSRTQPYLEVRDGAVVRANANQTVQLALQFGNRGEGTLVGKSIALTCTPAGGGAPFALELAPGALQQATNRDYPRGQNGNLVLRARPTAPGTHAFTCTLTVRDDAGFQVTSSADVTIDVRR
ncbi:endo-1,4-beta-xylanase [Kineococcus terrestris]|uniref:endo-1,4-beta-xylanase n=1 Tax=Kineococcus terrestris TaxID=2044856 RepID=UPI0034DB7C73